MSTAPSRARIARRCGTTRSASVCPAKMSANRVATASGALKGSMPVSDSTSSASGHRAPPRSGGAQATARCRRLPTERANSSTSRLRPTPGSPTMRTQAALRSSAARSKRARRSANGRSLPTRGASQRAAGCTIGAGAGAGARSGTTGAADSTTIGGEGSTSSTAKNSSTTGGEVACASVIGSASTVGGASSAAGAGSGATTVVASGTAVRSRTPVNRRYVSSPTRSASATAPPVDSCSIVSPAITSPVRAAFCSRTALSITCCQRASCSCLECTSVASIPRRRAGAAAWASRASWAAFSAARSLGGSSAMSVAGASGDPSNTAPAASKRPPTSSRTS